MLPHGTRLSFLDLSSPLSGSVPGELSRPWRRWWVLVCRSDRNEPVKCLISSSLVRTHRWQSDRPTNDRSMTAAGKWGENPCKPLRGLIGVREKVTLTFHPPVLRSFYVRFFAWGGPTISTKIEQILPWSSLKCSIKCFQLKGDSRWFFWKADHDDDYTQADSNCSCFPLSNRLFYWQLLIGILLFAGFLFGKFEFTISIHKFNITWQLPCVVRNPNNGVELVSCCRSTVTNIRFKRLPRFVLCCSSPRFKCAPLQKKGKRYLPRIY